MGRTAANLNPSFAGILHLIVVLVLFDNVLCCLVVSCDCYSCACDCYSCSCLLLLIMSCVSRIICEKDAACELEEFDPQTPTCADANITLANVTYESFAGDLCQADCEMSDAEEDASKRCRFWRFVSWTSLTA